MGHGPGMASCRTRILGAGLSPGLLQNLSYSPGKFTFNRAHCSPAPGDCVTAKSWQVVKDLFNQCLTMNPLRRDSFLENLTLNEEIRSELSRLLRNQELAPEEFLAPLEGVRQALLHPPNLLLPGDMLGACFRIDRFWQRRRGDVYQALDIDLAEDVAVKVLASSRNKGSGTLARSRGELQLARRVTHQETSSAGQVRIARTEGNGYWSYVGTDILNMNAWSKTANVQFVGCFSAIDAEPILRQILNPRPGP